MKGSGQGIGGCKREKIRGEGVGEWQGGKKEQEMGEGIEGGNDKVINQEKK